MEGTTIRKKDFVRLIDRFGINNELFTFNYCSEKGIDLGGSTIDKIVYIPQNEELLFYYNENTNDYESFESLPKTDVRKFYNELAWHIWLEDGLTNQQKEAVYEYLRTKFKTLFTDDYEMCEFLDEFAVRVYENISECADWSRFRFDEICTADVDIAVERLLKSLMQLWGSLESMM